MKANIITIGDEILIGQVVDSNSAFIAKELNQAGISVHRMISIGDKKEEIFSALNQTDEFVKIVLMTGGLGPTSDDITKPALAEYFGSKLVMNNEALKNIHLFFDRKNVVISERNLKQAEIPNNCTIIPNLIGTASGMWFEKNNIIYISMPGVPFEMKEMLINHIIPQLRNKLNLPAKSHYTIITSGVPESTMADKLSDWEAALPEKLKLAYLPSPGLLRLRLSLEEIDNGNPNVEISKYLNTLIEIVGDALVGFNEDTLESKIGEMLIKNKSTLAVAESCTGGSISSLITSVPGASLYFKGGMIAYSNEIKRNNLNVSPFDLEKYGAVSEIVVKQMAEGILQLYKTDYAIATSGIAGPDGGTPEKPVGTTWIAVASKINTHTKIFHFGDNRERNILRGSVSALNMLRLLIQSKI